MDLSRERSFEEACEEEGDEILLYLLLTEKYKKNKKEQRKYGLERYIKKEKNEVPEVTRYSALIKTLQFHDREYYFR